jgi:hypothetical protein
MRKRNASPIHADPYAQFLVRGIIGGAINDVVSKNDSKRREAVEWIFSGTEGPWSLRWVCGKARERIEEATGQRPGLPTPEAVRRAANKKIAEAHERGKLPV